MSAHTSIDTVRANLDQLIKQHGRGTQLKLAKAIGVDPATISGFRSGRFNLSPQKVDAIARYFKIEIADFWRPLDLSRHTRDTTSPSSDEPTNEVRGNGSSPRPASARVRELEQQNAELTRLLRGLAAINRGQADQIDDVLASLGKGPAARSGKARSRAADRKVR